MRRWRGGRGISITCFIDLNVLRLLEVHDLLLLRLGHADAALAHTTHGPVHVETQRQVSSGIEHHQSLGMYQRRPLGRVQQAPSTWKS